MNKRPPAVTVISCLYLLAGIVGLSYHATEFKVTGPAQYDLFWVLLVRLIAIVCAVFMFRGANWARWAAVFWMVYHVVLSAFHTASETIVHGLLLAVIAYFLFRRSSSAYFAHARSKSSPASIDPAT